jgi:hypothetical protein
MQTLSKARRGRRQGGGADRDDAISL